MKTKKQPIPVKQQALAKALRAPKPMPPIPSMDGKDQISYDGGGN